MHIKKLLILILLGVTCSLAFADVKISISKHPDKSFFYGYDKILLNGCRFEWDQNENNEGFIAVTGSRCEDLSTKEITDSVVADLAYVKSLKKYRNFEDYFKENRNYDDEYNRLPQKYWSYMDGYRYQYLDDCDVGWHARTSSFLLSAECPAISDELLKADAIKSIKYAQSKSNAENFSDYYYQLESKKKVINNYSREDAMADARDLWRRACLDAKELRPAHPNQLADSYPRVERLHSLRLVQSARQLVSGLGGVLNCAEYSQYAVEMYASDIDIRAR